VTRFETTDGEPEARTLPVEVWYPATPSGGAPPAHYELTIGTLVLADVESPLGAVRDAPADRRGAPHPVVVFSHGFGGVRFQSIYLTEWLATHGFVVAAPDHTGNTFAEQVNDANALPAARVARLRPIDVSRTLDALLERSADPADLLSGMSDPGRAGVVGHSFGGFTAFRIAGAEVNDAAVDEMCATSDSNICDGWGDEPFPASARDERFIAAIAQAPGGGAVFVGGGIAKVDVPMMIQAGTSDRTAPMVEEATPAFAALTSDAALVALDRAGHLTFSDLCAVVTELGIHDDAFDDGCSPDNVDPARAHELIDRYATAYFQVHVAGEPSLEKYLDPSAPKPEGIAAFETK